VVEGRAKIQGLDVVHQAVPAEDRMQAFLWRHFVPAEELRALVFNPSFEPPPKRVRRVAVLPHVEPKSKPAPAEPPVATPPAAPAKPGVPAKPKFTKQQVAGRLRQLKLLFEEGLLTDDFHDRKVAECEALR
jgi:hypothetical protein